MEPDPVVVRYTPGIHHALTWAGGAAVVDASLAAPVVERMWAAMRASSELGAFLQALAEGSGTGLLDLPDFAVALRQGARLHVAVRGSGGAVTASGDDADTLTGAGITTWAEKSLPRPERVELAVGVGDGEDDTLPMVDGVTRARALWWGEVTRPPAREDAAAPAGPDAPQTPAGDAPEASERRPEEPAVAEALPPQEAPPPQETPPSEEPAPNPYLGLWDKTMAVDIEAAAIRVDAEGAAAEPAPPPTSPAAPSSADDQRTADTVMDEGVADIVIPATHQTPRVLSRFCTSGHANPPERSQCFACDAPVVGEARSAPRPQLGWLRVEGGETIPLNGPLVAGRNPSSSALRLSEPARLVALPHAHVSSTHVAFVIEGWRVMVHDLGSRNGTYLRRHGKPAVRLPSAPYLLIPGDLIDLGKGLFLHLDRIP